MKHSAPDLTTALAAHYRIERELGAGGMATVYLAEDLKHKRRVALKVLKPELAAVLGAERFVQEITTTAALQHPHILPLFDSGEAGGFLYYVMPFIDGETLRAKLDRETQLGIDESVKIATAVADALDYAHRHGVIHRDIKPENILLHEGRPMVADFGIALAVSAAAGGRMTETGLSLGTPHYMSPEQATAEKEITGRSDIYSLASVLYEMLTGDPPHTGASVQQIIMKIITESPQPVTVLRKSVPANVAAAVSKALEKLPADRFASAAEFAAALRDERFSTVARATATDAKHQSRRFALVGAFVLTAAFGFAFAWALKDGTPSVAGSGPIYRFEVEKPSGYNSEGVGMNIVPNGTGALMIADGAAGHGIVMQSFDGASPRFFSAPAASIGSYMSRDGSGIYFYAFPGPGSSQVQLLPLSGAPPRVVTDSLRFGLAIDGDGRIYGTHLTTGGLTRVDRNGTVEQLTRPDTVAHERVHQFPKFVAGGRLMAFHIGYADGRPNRIAFVDLRQPVVHTTVEGKNVETLPNGYLIFSRDETLYAGRVDPSRLDFAGAPIPVLRGVGGYTVSETGSLLYRESTPSKWELRTNDGKTPDAAISAEGAAIGGVRLGPGARFLLTLEGAQNLWVRSPNGASRRLTVSDKPHRLAGWSPDGSRVLYVEFDEDPLTILAAPHTTVFATRVDGTGAPEQMIPNGGTSIREADWGRRGIAYATMDGTIWWLADGQHEPVKIATGEGGVGRSAWAAPTASPDGRFIAFKGKSSTVVVAAIPPGTGSWEVSPGLNPRWSSDGRFLYFDQVRLNYRAVALPVMRVPITPGASFSFGKPEVAATPPANATLLWDVAPGNVVYWVTQQQPRTFVVVNWMREVDSLVHSANGNRR